MAFLCCSRAFYALLRRNFVYRKRHYITSCIELLLPVAFMGIIVALKNASEIDDEDDIVSEMKSVGFYENMADFMSLLMTLGILYPSAAIIRYVVAEKEQKQKELLKISSVTEFDIGFSWFTSFLILHIITSVLITFISTKFYEKSDPILLLIFWLTSFISFIVLSMCIASIFSKTSRATFIGLLIFFFGYFITLAENFATGDPTILRLVSLHPMATFSYGLREIGRLEDTSYDGLNWNDINATTYESGYTFTKVIRYYFFDIVLYSFITWYCNRVIPPSYGQPLPFYFLFLPSYWFPTTCYNNKYNSNKVATTENQETASLLNDPSIPIENVSDAMKNQALEGKSIEIHNLKKSFGTKVAIDGLNLSIYSGQITALLGVNGAGKTTTINILTGAAAATEGTAIVAGKDIHTSMFQIRQNMGICLQHDCIFPSLTVREHIQLFCRIKGLYNKMSYKEAEEKVTQSLCDVALFDKSHCLAKNLSGGMKRKLSVAMAFCGESPVVILDEPTSGMDPFARRFTWDLIRHYRQDRTIILTTHQMDEADVLGDQIAILADGRLRCCGSSLFLKKSFGVGYHLTVEKGIRTRPQTAMISSSGSTEDNDAEANLKPQRSKEEVNRGDEVLKDIVIGTVQEAAILTNVAGEMTFQLPMSASHKFSTMLQQLDEEVVNGFIDSYGLSLTTLEEVFILVSRGDSVIDHPETEKLALTSTQLLKSDNTGLSQKDFQREGLFVRHVLALFFKRYLNFKRDKKAWLFTTILPSLFVFLGFLFKDSIEKFGIWFLVVLSFPFITGAFGSFVVNEKQNKAKHLQTIAGVTSAEYWISTLLWDVINYQFTLWITVILMFAFDVEDLTTTRFGVVGGVIVLLLVYGPAAASFTYCTSFLFSSPAYCNVLNIIWGFLIGFGGTIVVFLLWFFGNGFVSPTDDDGFLLEPQDNLLSAAKALSWTLRLFPSFNLGNGLFMAINLGSADGYVVGGSVQVKSVWQTEVLLWEVIFLGIENIVYLLLAIYLDTFNTNPKVMIAWRKFVRKITFGALYLPEITAPYSNGDDDDVVEEQNRVKSGEANTDLVVLKDLTKIYDNGKLAVDKLTLGIPAGECFGLLGINGAGKTTTMQMLTTEFPPTEGDASLGGYSIRKHLKETRSRIGYCPQFDALLMNLTGREHVQLYASIKGTPRSFVNQVVAEKLAAVGLSETDSDRLAFDYSGGMKRRLSLACATIGQPQLIFLDEPSTGVDPLGRREIWNMISSMMTDTLADDEKPVVILTTHSMEESEALCSRIGIMAHGKLRCLGSAQHLKTKFGRGYQLEMKVMVPQQNDEDFIRNSFILGRQKLGVNDESIRTNAGHIFYNYQEALSALNALSGDNYLANLITAQHPHGYIVYKACSGNGVSLPQLTQFATTEMRMRRLSQFVNYHYPTSVLREWQDLKARYELSSDNLRISQIFEMIEENKESLALADYSVSQTTLENVFQLHAAQAEALKQRN